MLLIIMFFRRSLDGRPKNFNDLRLVHTSGISNGPSYPPRMKITGSENYGSRWDVLESPQSLELEESSVDPLLIQIAYFLSSGT